MPQLARSLFFYIVFQLTSGEEKERRRKKNAFYGTFVSRIYFAFDDGKVRTFGGRRQIDSIDKENRIRWIRDAPQEKNFSLSHPMACIFIKYPLSRSFSLLRVSKKKEFRIIYDINRALERRRPWLWTKVKRTSSRFWFLGLKVEEKKDPTTSCWATCLSRRLRHTIDVRISPLDTAYAQGDCDGVFRRCPKWTGEFLLRRTENVR